MGGLIGSQILAIAGFDLWIAIQAAPGTLLPVAEAAQRLWGGDARLMTMPVDRH